MRRMYVGTGSARVPADLPQRRRERIRGLLGSTSGRALLILGARSVHTFGMREPIDVVLLDPGYRVLRVVRMRPHRVLLPRPGVRHVLEMRRAPFRVGQVLWLEDDQAGQPPSPADPVTTH